MLNPLVSIIVPVYNVENYLAKCLESLINQSLKNIEIICVNDCSSDKSLDVLNKYSALDSKVRIINNNINKGLSYARNIGIQESKANYIMFCDSDDFYEPDMCFKMYNAINDNSVELAICDVNVINTTKDNWKDSNLYIQNFSGIISVSDELVLS